MNLRAKIRNHRDIITIALALIGIALMFFYSVCDTSCSYLKGDIFGIDLKYIGIGYMLAIIAFALSKQTALVRILLASGIGVEVFLVAFQFREDVFCPFCIAFGAVVVLAFILNYERPQTKGGWRRRIIYGLGETELPLIKTKGIPLLLFVILGYLFVVLTFSGSATPAYGAERPSAPHLYVKVPGSYSVAVNSSRNDRLMIVPEGILLHQPGRLSINSWSAIVFDPSFFRIHQIVPNAMARQVAKRSTAPLIFDFEKTWIPFALANCIFNSDGKPLQRTALKKTDVLACGKRVIPP